MQMEFLWVRPLFLRDLSILSIQHQAVFHIWKLSTQSNNKHLLPSGHNISPSCCFLCAKISFRGTVKESDTKMEGVQEYSVVVTVFSFLDGLDILKNASRVCRTWNSVSKEEVVHKHYIHTKLQQHANLGLRKLKTHNITLCDITPCNTT